MNGIACCVNFAIDAVICRFALCAYANVKLNKAY